MNKPIVKEINMKWGKAIKASAIDMVTVATPSKDNVKNMVSSSKNHLMNFIPSTLLPTLKM